MISKQLQQKLDFYEQVYYSLDKPVPFKEGLDVYPVKVSDYYNFYSCYPCITMDKNIKIIVEDGKQKKVPNPLGISQSYMEYLIDTMQDKDIGPQITNQVMQLFELIFHIKRGYYCPKCFNEIEYSELLKDMDLKINELVNKTLEEIKENYLSSFEDKENVEIPEIPKQIMDKIYQKCKFDYFQSIQVCPECGSTMRDVFSIKTDEHNFKKIVIKNIEISNNEFDELKALIPRQNILDYDGDNYMDPDLKEELELKAKMQNKDYTSPTLEKQLICVGVGTGYTLEYLQTLTMRKLSYLLKIVDKKNMYYAQMQGMMSGMVQFKEDPKHWIFSDDKKNIADELTSLDSFEKKFERVT